MDQNTNLLVSARHFGLPNERTNDRETRGLFGGSGGGQITKGTETARIVVERDTITGLRADLVVASDARTLCCRNSAGSSIDLCSWRRPVGRHLAFQLMFLSAARSGRLKNLLLQPEDLSLEADSWNLGGWCGPNCQS